MPFGNIFTEVTFMTTDNSGGTEPKEIEQLKSELKVARSEISHIADTISGGIAICTRKDGRVSIDYFSDGVLSLTGFSEEEYAELIKNGVDALIYEADKKRVHDEMTAALAAGAQTVKLSVRVTHKTFGIVWVNLHVRIANQTDGQKLFCVFTGQSEEVQLYRSIANDSADGIYVVDRETYEIYYVNESHKVFLDDPAKALGRTCYDALCHRSRPCEYCPLRKSDQSLSFYKIAFPEKDNKIYSFRFRKIEWYGIPAYVIFLSDITEETETRKKKDSLEQYFRMIVKHIQGGVAVFAYDKIVSKFTTEYMSPGFASMFGMTQDEIYSLYKDDPIVGIHPDDQPRVLNLLKEKIDGKSDTNFEIEYRLLHKDGYYVWVRNASNYLYTPDEDKIYSIYSDITEEMAERDRVRSFYKELLYRHHRASDPNLIVAANCNLSTRRIVRVTDRLGGVLESYVDKDRDEFFRIVSTYIENEKERKQFLDAMMTDNLLDAFAGGRVKCEMDSFVKFPGDNKNRYVRFTVNLMKSPDNGDVIGILSVVDYTDRRVGDRIMNNLFVNDYDFIIVLDISDGQYTTLSYDESAKVVPARYGDFGEQVARFLDCVVPRDRAEFAKKLSIDYITGTLAKENSFTLHYMVSDARGDIYSKSTVVFWADRRLNKVCIARSDITDSVREQRGLINMLAYAFEIVAFIDVETRLLTVYTRDCLLKNLQPAKYDNMDEEAILFSKRYGTDDTREDIRTQLSVDTILSRLDKSPDGYEFSFLCVSDDPSSHGEERCKLVSVMWADNTHRAVCMVRTDITDTMQKERETREHLRSALELANEANRAKTDFLSAMSHDIRTPMNAIVGMTELALSDRNNPEQIDESLAVIRSSSENLLRLINEILDMSRIESGRLAFNNEVFSMSAEFDKLVVSASALAEDKNLLFEHSINIQHDSCVGDAVRLYQVMTNLVGNAVKFTPEHGKVTVTLEEMAGKNPNIGFYRYTVSDTGIGIEKKNLKRIFEPFFRADDPTISRIEGTGLGLSIVKNLIESRGGTIRVESKPGCGSKFTAEMPLHFSDEPMPIKKAVDSDGENNYDLNGARVLLVEDNEINSVVAAKLMERVGIEVDIAENGKEGLEKFLASPAGCYSSILMDIQMPVMNGYDATRAIRASDHPQSKGVPIIAMTANAFSSDVSNCIAAGMNAHISKPIDPDKFYKILKTFVGGGGEHF